MKWNVTGAWKADGAEAQMSVEAPNQRAAESIAAQRGMMVEQAIPESTAVVAAPVHQAVPMYREPPPQHFHQPPQVVYAPAPPQASFVNNVIVHGGPSFSPGVAAILSFFIPGLGQMYKGQIINGVVWFCVVVVGYVCFIIPGLILHLFCILGAASGSNRR